MCISSLFNPGVRSRIVRMLFVVGSALLVSLPSAAFAQATTACGPDVKEEVARALAAIDNYPAAEKAKAEADLYAKYLPCGANDVAVAPASFFAAARQCSASVSNLGSLFYEEMSCCGYDPQRRQFACPVKIKQTVGYGPTPLPGSREHVLHCVADGNGILRPVGHDSVHLSNAIPGNFPSWQFAVIAAANDNLQLVQPMNGATRNARSILSWGFSPNNNCAFVPIWGNALNYRIRLDQ
jgi:hypothetical protein